MNDRTTYTYTPPNATGLDADLREMLTIADGVLTATTYTADAAAIFAASTIKTAPAGVADIPGVAVWLAKVLHSAYMTGRASGCAQLLGTDIKSLARSIAAELPDSYAARVIKEAGWTDPRTPTDAQRAFIDALKASPGELTATEMPAAEPTTGPALSEADEVFAMVERVIAQHPGARISLDGMPPGVETRLRAKYPADKFFELTPEMVRAMNEAKGATKN